MTENILLFGSPDTQKKYSWNQSSQQEIAELFDTLDSVVLRGGEPFMVPWIKDILEQVPESRAQQIEILFNTNLTKLTADWIPVLSKFKNIKMSCSIDALGSLLHYVRFPSTWAQVQAGLAVARMLPNANIFLNVCVQNVNILHLDKLLEWANQENLYVVLDILTEPKIFQVDNLPQPLIQQALVVLENVKNKINTDLVSNLDGVINALHNNDTNPELWNKFLEHVRVKDRHRNISIAKEIPELQEYINA
jgi:sulfatase maturation enzyme AslB (radical SAM superfamily)